MRYVVFKIDVLFMGDGRQLARERAISGSSLSNANVNVTSADDLSPLAKTSRRFREVKVPAF